MDNNDNFMDLPSDDVNLSVDAILAEYEAERALFSEEESRAQRAEPTPEPEPEPPAYLEEPEREAPREGVNRIVYDSREQAIGEADFASDEAGPGAQPILDTPEPEFEEIHDEPVLVSVAQPEEKTDYDELFEEIPAQPEKAQLSIELPPSGGALDRHSLEELIAEAQIPDEAGEGYAEAGDYSERARSRSDYEEYSEYAEDEDGQPRRAAPRAPDFRERVLSPLIGLITASSQRREEKRRIESERLRREKKEEPPELRADRAASFYDAQAQALRLRCILASAAALVLLWISFGLPAAGLLGRSPTIKALVCLVLELVVLVMGLDIFSTGLLTLFRKKPGAETLIAVSALVSAADALIIAFSDGSAAIGLPFCGASALAVVLALWGNYFNCRALALSIGTAAVAENPTCVVALSGVDAEGAALARVKRPVTGFVRNAEAADVFESAYRLLAPILIVGSIVLSAFVFFASEKCTSFSHTLAASLAACASLSAVFGFAFPYYVLAKRLSKSGVAVAGCQGASELGRVKRVLIFDRDLFPPRTLSIADVSMAEGVRADTVIAYTGSMIAAAGMSIAPVFTELMRRNACSMQKVEDFACHEGGGLVARVNGDLVYVGSSGFMQLMGIRLPKGAGAKSAVYTAINDSLAGIFAVNYKPVASVQRALVSLFRGKTEPLFVVRDFNITPVLLKQKFRLPRDSYNFPSFADRYRISSIPEDSGSVSAMFSRGGLNSLSGLISRGGRLYSRVRANLALSIVGVIVGMVLMLALCWSGSFDSASCGNLIAFMALWLVPTFIISLGLRN